MNITKTVRKYPIDSNLRPIGSEFQSGPLSSSIKHDYEDDEEYAEGSVSLSEHNFDRIVHAWVDYFCLLYYFPLLINMLIASYICFHSHPILVVNFYAPWCGWSKLLVNCLSLFYLCLMWFSVFSSCIKLLYLLSVFPNQLLETGEYNYS